MGRQTSRNTQAGFSLVELVIAMTVTLIISGAVFQLVNAGSSAFRREPELADRQQSIRMAMDIISQDLYRAGSGLPSFAQVFTDNLNAQGPMGPGGADADVLELSMASDCPPLTVCEVSGAQLTTREMISSCYNLPSLVILANTTEWYPYWAEAPGNASNASCPAGNNDGSNSGGGNSGGGNSGGGNSGGGDSGGGDSGGGDSGGGDSGGGDTGGGDTGGGDTGGGDTGGGDTGGGNNGGGNNGGGNNNGGGKGGKGGKWSSLDGTTGTRSAGIVNVARTRTRSDRGTVTHTTITGRSRTSRVVRTANNKSRNGHLNFPPGRSSYNNPGGPNKVFANPPLWVLVGQVIRYRINIDANGVPNLERSTFGGQNLPDGSSSWQIIAGGVEDLQVEYLNGTGWQDTPGTITCGANCGAPTTADYDTVIRRVRVRLSARAMAANLQGQTSSAVGDAVRGELVTEVAPRPAVATIGLANGDF